MSIDGITINPIKIVDAFALTHVGMVRDHNEDAVISDPDRGIFVLADGMGGHLGGEIASAIAVAETHKALATWACMSGKEENRLTSIFRHADDTVQKYGKEHVEVAGLGTTLVTAQLIGDTMWIGHVGDSRAYLFRGGELSRLTKDHGNGQFLSTAIGMLGKSKPDVNPVTIRRRDVIFLCSDGLSNFVNNEAISGVLTKNRRTKDACNNLVKATLNEGAPDNVTVVVIRFG